MKEEPDMPKLRRMLGDARHPMVLSLMRLMETQSHQTLVRWAVDSVRERYLPLTEDPRLHAAVTAAGGWADGMLSLQAAQPALREARQAAQEETEPVRQAAARAIATACSAVRNRAILLLRRLRRSLRLRSLRRPRSLRNRSLTKRRVWATSRRTYCC